MPYAITECVTTPNPNALKFVLDAVPAGAIPRSYTSRPADGSVERATNGQDPLADSLFAIPGVTTLLIHDGWITVCKSPDAAWKTIKPAVKRALAGVA